MQIKDHATHHAINHSIVVVINNIKIMKDILLLTFYYTLLCVWHKMSKFHLRRTILQELGLLLPPGFEFITEGPPDICKPERVSDMLVMLTLSSFVYIQTPQ